MELVQVINNKIVQYSLPKVGILKDGSTVSGYNLLPLETLTLEGWLPLEDNLIPYNPDTEYLIPSYTILSDKVVKSYTVGEAEESIYEVGLIALRKLIRVDELTADEMIELMDIYPEWETLLTPEPQKAKVGKCYRYQENLYKVRTEHTVQANYTPDITPSLYWIYYPEGVIPNHIVGRPYALGDKIIFNDEVYESLQNNNVWSPTDKPDYWKKELAEGEVEDYIPNKWYKLGDKMRFTDGLVYESTFVGDNVWNPTTYPQGWKLVL